MGEDGQEYIISSQQFISPNLRELWRFRELFYYFAWRDIKVKYKQTVLGVAWVVLQPVLIVAVFSFFFGRTLNVPSDGLPYPVFVFSGLLLWNFFSVSISNGGNSMVANAPIIKKIYFPRVVIPVATLLVSFIDFLIAGVVFLGVLIYYHTPVNVLQALLYWPLSVAILVMGTLGISCWLSALSVKYRDFRYVIPFGLQVLLFMSPVIYPTSIVSNPWINYLLALNPTYAPISIFRIPLMGYSGQPQLMAISLLSGLFFMMYGVYYFRRTEAFFADIA